MVSIQIACIPPVSEKKSAIMPLTNASTSNNQGFMFEGKTIINSTYSTGVINLPSCIGSSTIVCKSKMPTKYSIYLIILLGVNV